MSADAERPWRITPQDREQARRALQESHDERTICNVLRRIYTLSTSVEQKALIEECIWMAKKMDKRLRFYKKDWDCNLWIQERSNDEHNNKP